MRDLDGPFHSYIATTYGVTENSILNELKYFHVVDGIVPDIMHDILEGTTQVTMKCLLLYLIHDKKYPTFKILNESMRAFDYGNSEICNKQSEISKNILPDSSSLRQSGIAHSCAYK